MMPYARIQYSIFSSSSLIATRCPSSNPPTTFQCHHVIFYPTLVFHTFQGPLHGKASEQSRSTYVFCTTSMAVADGGDVGQVTIDMLPDDVLLDIFDFCLKEPPYFIQDWSHTRSYSRTRTWQKLVHVCRRWRDVVFQSPRRLDLQICCTTSTPVKEMPNIWPTLPLIVYVGGYTGTWSMGNIIAAFKHRDRICGISINHSSKILLETLLPVMREPFPALASLDLVSHHGMARIPDYFLGGSAPHLRHLHLKAIQFLALPKLLLSATDLVTLTLSDVPHSGYISPEAIVTSLFAMTSLKSFHLEFQSPRSRPDQRSQHLPPSTRSVLPALTYFNFEGSSEYLESILARIDAAPLLDCLEIFFFNQPIFQTPYLSQFISHVPKFQALKEARVVISRGIVSVRVLSPMRTLARRVLTVGISRRDMGWRFSSLVQLCTSSLPLLTAEHLHMVFPPLHWQDIEKSQLLELLHQFVAVKNLYLSKKFVAFIAPALQELVGERVIEVLPALQKLFLVDLHPPGPDQEAIGQFLRARSLSSHPVTVLRWVVERWMLDDW